MSATLTFQDFEFIEQDKVIRVIFLKQFYFNIKKQDLERIGSYQVNKNSIIFEKTSEKSASNKFNRLIGEGFQNLKNRLNDHNTSYIHQNSGIPLIGSRSFGIIDRGTDMLELKPLTSCNINCVYCSVDEGLSTKKTSDIIVEKDYLTKETKKLVEFKQQEKPTPINIYINPQGEPLLYAEIVELTKDLKSIEEIDEIHIITNGNLLTKQLIDNLARAGLTHLNISISALDERQAKILAGTAKYDIHNIKEMIDYAKNKIKIIITPVYVPTMNDKDLEDIIAFAKQRKLQVMIQNFLENKRGRTPVKQKSWDDFFAFLKDLEKKYHVDLTTVDSKIELTTELPVPFKRDELVKAEVVAQGRYHNEALAVAKDRAITVFNYTFEKHKTIKIKIIRTKHNIITAKAVE